eukprot:3941590-Rhodomonas_salina.2
MHGTEIVDACSLTPVLRWSMVLRAHYATPATDIPYDTARKPVLPRRMVLPIYYAMRRLVLTERMAPYSST